MASTIALFIGIGLLAVAVILAVREHFWLRKARVTTGTVIELIASRGSKGKATYKPRVEFVAADRSRHEFIRSYSSSPAGFRVGERVAVAYDAQNYQGRILTFGQRFGLALVIGSVGLAVVTMALGFIVGRTVVPRIYQESSATILSRDAAR